MTAHRARDPLYAQSCKGLFWAFWLALLAFEAVALWAMEVPAAPKAYLISLIVVTTLLNGASYSLCCVYVWFLNALSKTDGLERLGRNRHMPLLTPKYRKLSGTSKVNTLTFLFVTLQFSATMLLDCLLLPHGEQLGLVQLLCFLSVLLIGTVTFFVLFQCSREFLERILERWRADSIRMIQDEYDRCVMRMDDGSLGPCGLIDSSEGAVKCIDAYKDVAATEKMGRVDFLTLVLAALSVLVNVVTAAIIP